MLSCDSVEETGLPEYEGNFNYYDYVAYGWSEFLNQQYDNAISFFQQALLLDDVNEDGESDYMHHSAYVGISWALTFQANELLNDTYDNIVDLREEAIQYLCYFKNESNEWIEGDCENNSSEINDSYLEAFTFYDISDNETTSCYGDYCCSNCFIEDKDVAMIFYYSYQYHDYFFQNDLANAAIYYDKAIQAGLKFVSSTELPSLLDINKNYNFMDGKPIDSPVFNMKYNNIIILLGQLYLKNEEYNNAALILNEICDDVSSSDIQSIINCVQSF